MNTLILVIHVITCCFLIIFVLLQAGKGADAGATFGSSLGQTYFGSQGGNILTKITSVLAIVFMLTSIALTVIHHQKTSKSVVADYKNEAVVETNSNIEINQTEQKEDNTQTKNNEN